MMMTFADEIPKQEGKASTRMHRPLSLDHEYKRYPEIV